jgi:hypothetical protein
MLVLVVAEAEMEVELAVALDPAAVSDGVCCVMTAQSAISTPVFRLKAHV